MRLRVNSAWKADCTVCAISYTSYTTTNIMLASNDIVELAFVNGDGTRELWAEKVVVDGAEILAGEATMVFDRGSGNDAYDGFDVGVGTSCLGENGALRFAKGPNARNAGCDENGNMTIRLVDGEAYVLTYDAEQRLTAVDGHAEAQFWYDGYGNRVRSIANGTATYYVGNYYEVTGNTVTKYYYFAGYRVAMTSTGSANPTFIHGDHLGSAVNTTGQFTNTEMYLPYGGIRGSSTVTTPYRFTGQRELGIALRFTT